MKVKSINWASILGQATQLGLTMGVVSAAMVIAGLAGGRYLDSCLGTAPWLTIALTLIGAVLGQLALVYIALRARRELVGADQCDRRILIRPIVKSLALVFALLLAVIAVLGLGLWLDHLLHTRVLFTLFTPVLILVAAVITWHRHQVSGTLPASANQDRIDQEGCR